MATRERRADVGAARARQIVGDLARDAREARLAGSLSQREVAAAAGLDRSRLSRIERGQAGTLTIEQACRLLAVLGFELAVRAHPVGEPIRDAAQLALLARFRGHLHPSLA